MLQKYLVKPSTAVKILTEKDFSFIKKHVRNVLTSQTPLLDIGDGFKLYSPRTKGALFTLNETLGRELSPYENIKGVESVLDLGGFIGDSALFFLKNNTRHIVVCEARKEHCEYLTKNIELNRERINDMHDGNYSIRCIQAAVVTDTSLSWECEGQSGRGQNIVKPSINASIPIIHIEELLKMHDFDALKMDIEGGEFPIMKRFQENPEKFTFSKGYIEFHQVNVDTYYQEMQSSIDFITKLGYSIQARDYEGNLIDRNALGLHKENNYITIYFEKK